MAPSGQRCAYQGCSRVQSTGCEPFCWQHYRMSTEYLDAGGGVLDETHQYEGLRVPTRPSKRYDINTANAYHEFVGDHGEGLMNAVGEWNPTDGAYADRTIPENAVEHGGEWNESFRDLMIKHGIPKQNIKRIQFQGIKRYVPEAGRFQQGARVQHEAILLENKQGEDCVVDPSVAALAPVRYKAKKTAKGKVREKQSDQPIDDIYPSGVTPYGDSPYITTLSEYMRNYSFSWKSNTIEDW